MALFDLPKRKGIGVTNKLRYGFSQKLITVLKPNKNLIMTLVPYKAGPGRLTQKNYRKYTISFKIQWKRRYIFGGGLTSELKTLL